MKVIVYYRRSFSALASAGVGGYRQYLSDIDVTVHVPEEFDSLEINDQDFQESSSPSKAEKIEYSLAKTRETVCVSRTLPGLPLRDASSAR